jgi:C-3',4' desaturase CrtD
MKTNQDAYDIIVVGSGMGGLTAAALLTKDGYRVLVLEAAHVAGGCSSSYRRKGYVYESGATTLVGFDPHQPLHLLQTLTGIDIPRKRLHPGMTVWINVEPLHRFEDRQQWIQEVIRVFGQPEPQRAFWKLALKLSDLVWKVSGINKFFPPRSLADWLFMVRNNAIQDVWALRYAFTDTATLVRRMGITNPAFMKFIDEQLLISAQSKADETPFLFAAPALCYTNYGNYYVPGGLIRMAEAVQSYIEQQGGKFLFHRKVTKIHRRTTQGWMEVETAKGDLFKAKEVVSNLPIWNMAELTEGETQAHYQTLSKKYDKAWGAYTVCIACKDVFPDDLGHHHQIHVPSQEGKSEGLPHIASTSIFVSISERNDTERAPEGTRVINVSTHTDPDFWFQLGEDYDLVRQEVEEAIVTLMIQHLPGFTREHILDQFTATPITWENWIYRKKGRVGGLPQSMQRNLLDWPAEKPNSGIWMCGDTVYPGQGIPGVTLSGINVYYRIKRHLSRNRRHLV